MIIGLVGIKASGKDTVADFLVKHYGFVKEAFASPLKSICKEMFLLTDDQLNNHILKEQLDERWGKSPRQMFQQFGTDIVRNYFGSDFWIRHMELRTLGIKQPIVISDVRFKNEADWIESRNGILIRIANVKDKVGPDDDMHQSEQEQYTIHTKFTIINNKKTGLPKLYSELREIFRPLIGEEIQNMLTNVHKGWLTFLEKQGGHLRKIMDKVNADKDRYTIYPPSDMIFRSISYFAPEDTKLVIIGQDPYIGYEEVDGEEIPQACGLSFSVPSSHEKLPPSLKNIYKEIHSCYPDYKVPTHGSLARWAEEEHILLLNSSLTVIKGDSNSHQEYWEEFTDELISYLSSVNNGTIFLLMGKFAAEKTSVIDTTKHKVFTTVHPSPLSANRGFFGCGVFKKINDHLVSTNKKPIEWFVKQ